jgi:hypothetical protein
MAQPALSPASSDLAPLVAESAGWLPIVHQAEGPANRVLSELTLALSAGEPNAEKWSTRASLRFIFATCGGFWLLAAVLFYTFH